MNLLGSLLSGGDGGVVQQLAGQFGINPEQATSAVSTMMPALAGGLKHKLEGGGAPGIVDLITGGSLQKYATDPSSLSTPAAAEQGKSLISQIFGGGEGISGIVSMVAEKSGISPGIIQTMLPVVTTLFAGFVSKNVGNGGQDALMSTLGTLAGEHAGILGAMKGMASKLFG